MTGEGSLAGRTVVVTRPPGQSEELSRKLLSRGAKVLEAPAIELVPAPRPPLDRAARDLAAGRFEWAIFTSRAGVDAIASALDRAGLGFEGIRCRLAAVGQGTARALESRGARPDLVPPTFTTSDLGRAMPRGTGRVLLARADIAPEGLEETLALKGWTPVRVDAYRTHLAACLPGDAAKALRDGTVDAITFTSASTVEGFVGMAGPLSEAGIGLPGVVCIGPVTASAARLAGMRVVAVARPHTIDGLVAALERGLGRRRRKES